MSDSHWVYRLFGDGDTLLYVGYSNAPGVRWESHAATKDWWSDVRRIESAAFGSRQEALDHERAAILLESPTHNVARYRTIGGKTPLHSFRIPHEDWNAAKAAARSLGTNLTAVLRDAVDDVIKRAEQVEKPTG
jgi:hypothetical protein